MNKQPQQAKKATEPRYEPLLALIFTATAMAVVLIALIINKFIFPFSHEPLSPIIAQVLILLVPAYVLITLVWGHDSREYRLAQIGIKRLRAEYIFLLVFASFFAVCTSFLLNMISGGTQSAANGFSLFGLFLAGEGEFSVSSPYLIATYVLVPAIIEELVFRGVIFAQMRRTGTASAIALTTLISSLFFFSPLQLPDAIVCSLIFVFVYVTTASLLSSMIVHVVLNLFRLFLQTNMSVYFTSSQNTTLLSIVVLLAWLLSGALFFSEAARIYRARALKSQAADEASPTLPTANGILKEFSSVFVNKPTLIAAAVVLALYAAITVISGI